MKMLVTQRVFVWVNYEIMQANHSAQSLKHSRTSINIIFFNVVSGEMGFGF